MTVHIGLIWLTLVGAAQIVGADRAGYGVAPVDDQERCAVGADLLGLALVVFDLAAVATVAQDRGRLLPVEADLGGEGQDVRGV